MEPVRISMLGEFTLEYGENCLREAGSRARRIWGLLAYLICHRGQLVPHYKLIQLLWSSGEIANPESALRLLVHRSRTLLDRLYPGAGRECLLSREGGCGWNNQVPVEVDWERFEQLCQPGMGLEALLEGLSLYRGEFLACQSSENWVIPVAAHFQNLFLEASRDAARLLSRQGRQEEAIRICRNAIAQEPYWEPAYRALMEALAAKGDVQGAAEAYDSLRRRLLTDFGIGPSEETQAVYRAAVHAPEDRILPMEEVLAQLQEPEAPAGALQCDYDYFKMLCFAQRRAGERSGEEAHVVLLSVMGPEGKALSQRSLNWIMDQLGQVLRTNLRRGDVVSRCSASQYIFLLPKASFENSGMVCRRVLAAFRRVHPHVGARFHYLVQPLAPGFRAP